MSTIALVSSELQALTLAEGLAAGRLASCTVRVLGPWRPDAELSDLLSTTGEVRTLSVRDLGPLSTADVVILGDAYSRLGGALIMTRRPTRVVVLEDGAATLRARRQVSRGAPLRRVNRRGRVRSLESAETSFLLKLSEKNRLEWWLSDRHSPVRGVGEVWEHRFRRLRRAAPLHTDDDVRRLVVGSALTSDGHLRSQAYERWLRSIPVDGQTYFVPHRRELSQHKKLVRGLGMSVLEPGVGIERAVCQMPALAELHSLPTTPVLTVPIVRPDIDVHCTALGATEWASAASSSISELCSLVLNANRRSQDVG